MVTWQEGPPPAFDDWTEMREIYLSLLRPRKNLTAEMPAQHGREGEPRSAERIDRSAPRHLAQSAAYQNIA